MPVDEEVIGLVRPHRWADTWRLSVLSVENVASPLDNCKLVFVRLRNACGRRSNWPCATPSVGRYMVTGQAPEGSRMRQDIQAGPAGPPGYGCLLYTSDAAD